MRSEIQRKFKFFDLPSYLRWGALFSLLLLATGCSFQTSIPTSSIPSSEPNSVATRSPSPTPIPLQTPSPTATPRTSPTPAMTPSPPTEPTPAPTPIPTPSAPPRRAALSPSSEVTDWIVKDVCANSTQVFAFDPYYECPAGSVRRKVKLGDPLPFHNVDQGNYQQGDSYPTLDALGNILYMQTFDFAPFNRFNLTDGSDGYDYYAIKDGWFSGAGTRDGGGFATIFFGPNCSIGTGWVFFPAVGFLSGGETIRAISGDYWEQNGRSFPGHCPNGSGDSLTKWEFVPNYPFGGINGNPVKHMDTMISYHGFEPGNPTAGMEVFYYTRQYGKTRWEAWRHISTNPKKTENCTGPNTINFKGQTFVAVDCRDWSQVKLSQTEEIPPWPMPPANLLQHSHFDNDGGYGSTSAYGFWNRGGSSVEGNIINWSLLNSAANLDRKYGSGVRYLATNCAGTCTGVNVQQIYQELPISSFTNGGTYLYGAFARTEGGPGTLLISIQELSGNVVVWSDEFTQNILSYNGTHLDPEFISSVYFSSAYLYKTIKIPVIPGADRIRFIITPLTGTTTFDIVDTYLQPFPEILTSLKQQ